MRVLVAAEMFPPHIGGGATYAYNLVRGLIEMGHEVNLVYYGLRAKPAVLGAKRARSVPLGLPRFLRYALYFLKLLCVCSKCRVIYALGPVFSGWPALWVKKITNKKLVVRIFGDQAWEKGVSWSKIVDSLESFQKKKYKGVIGWLKKIQLYVAREADLIVVQSLHFKKLVCGWLGGCSQDHKDDKCANDKIRVIYNSIEPKVIDGVSKEEAQKKIGIEGDILLTVANIVPKRTVSTLIRLMPQLLKVNPNFKLVVVGKGDWLDFYRVLVKELELDASIFLVGRVPFKEVGYYYLAADLFLLNSKYEGLPFVIFEALQYKVPIISSRVGGISEIIEHNVNGILVEYNNHEEWLKAIIDLWHDKSTQECFKACNVTSLGVFDQERMITETVDALQSILK